MRCCWRQCSSSCASVPLLDRDFGYPPVIVFQSWERSLAIHDHVTRTGIDSLISNVFSFYIGEHFSNVHEVSQFATDQGDKFISAVERGKLFVAPGGAIGEPVHVALLRYRAEIEEWRTGAHLENLKRLSDAE